MGALGAMSSTGTTRSSTSTPTATPEPRTAATSALQNLDACTPAHGAGAPHRPPTPPAQLDSMHLRPTTAALVVRTPTYCPLPTAHLRRVVGSRLDGTLLRPGAAAPV
ncbi:hypothetical protein DXG01_001770, partial [Tephrocybe rancida]